MPWLTKVIAEGIQSMVVARLRYAPPPEDVAQVVSLWVTVFNEQMLWDREQDEWRIKRAFLDAIWAIKDFPSPRQIVEFMPKRKIIPPQKIQGTPMPEAIREQLNEMGIRLWK